MFNRNLGPPIKFENSNLSTHLPASFLPKGITSAIAIHSHAHPSRAEVGYSLLARVAVWDVECVDRLVVRLGGRWVG